MIRRVLLLTAFLLLTGHAPEHVITGRDQGIRAGFLASFASIRGPLAAAFPEDEERPAPRNTESVRVDISLVDGGRGAAGVAQPLGRSPLERGPVDMSRRAPTEHSGPAPLYAEVTAYTAQDHCAPDDPGAKWCDGLTASMHLPVEGKTLACPRRVVCPADPAATFDELPEVGLPLGSRVELGGRIYTCHDRGHLIVGRRFDLYMNSAREAFRWGRRRIRYRVLESKEG